MTALTIIAVALCALSHAAPDMYCGEENIEVANGTIQLARHWEAVFVEEFEDGLGNWNISNYEGKLEIGVSEDGATGKGLLVTNHESKGDTAFEVTSQPIDVPGGAAFRFEFACRSNRSFERLSGHKGQYMTQLQWLDEAGEALDPVAFTFGKSSKQWQVRRVEGTTPGNTVSLVIRFGFDHPNVADKEFLAIDNVRLEVRAEPAAFERSGFILSRPLQVTGDARRISWQADVPAGTAVQLQVASAPDEDGGPGEWSDPTGPDGATTTSFAQPGPLPPAHAGRPWLRYLAKLETEDPAKTPALSAVKIGDTTDGPWTGRDVTPPAVTERSPTRHADAKAPIWFRLTDDVGVDPRTVRVKLDGTDVTQQFVLADGKYVYTPPEALEPRPFDPGLARWRVRNHGRNLTIERTARRTPRAAAGLHITREAGQVDTAFSIRSPLIAVEPGATYELSYWSRHSMNLKGAMNSEGAFSGGVLWLAPDDTPLGERTTIDFGEANDQWHQDTYELVAPEGALNAQIAFGFDHPNIFDGGFVDIAEVTFDGPHPAREVDRPNLHRVTVEAADFAGNLLSRDWHILIKEPRTKNVVTIRDDGVTLIDGEPFFPIGLYAVWKKPFNDDNFDKAFGDLKAAGFNLAHTYSSARGPDFYEFYAAAHRHGIKLYVASDAGANCTNVETVLWDVVREEREPALLAWYLADDTASHVGHDELRAVSEAIHDVDPAHITVQADGVGSPPVSRYTNYVNSTDGFLPELYPIRGDSDKGVPRIIADMKTIQADLAAAGTRQKTVWAIVQYFQGWGWPRYPTKEELWAMSYLSIIHGAHGITWYTYGGWGDNHGVTDTPEVWKNICDLAGELSQLQEVFVQRTGPQPSPPKILSGPAKDGLDYPSISILLKERGGKKYLFAANSANAEVTAQFTVGRGAKITLPFEGREIAADERGFADTFGPYAVHVYVWE